MPPPTFLDNIFLDYLCLYLQVVGLYILNTIIKIKVEGCGERGPRVASRYPNIWLPIYLKKNTIV